MCYYDFMPIPSIFSLPLSPFSHTNYEFSMLSSACFLCQLTCASLSPLFPQLNLVEDVEEEFSQPLGTLTGSTTQYAGDLSLPAGH